jgi:mannose-6-phosphate isomerase-like protein (cupin superfamily)
MKKCIFGTLILTCVLGTVSFAQTRQPSAPLRPFIVKTAQSVADLEKSLGNENKVTDLIGGEGMQLRVAVQHDETRPTAEAEVHDASDDVFYALEGEAQLILGGKLDNPREATPGEWKSDKINGGETFIIKKGDLIVVPRGTPHQRIAVKGKEFSLILIKIFAEPIRPAVKPVSGAKEIKN